MDKIRAYTAKLFFIHLILGLGLSHSTPTEKPDKPPQPEKTKTFIYEGNLPSVTYKLQNKVVETRYRTEEIPSTCTRQVPYQENVCEEKTKYRKVCETVPGQNICYDVPDQKCHDETTTRQVCRDHPPTQVCRPGPDRRVCHRTPGREVCRPGRSRKVCESRGPRRECETTPGREVCENRPGKKVCRIRNGKEICRERPDRRVCRREPGNRVCRTVPGERTCRNVPGAPICRSIPGERQCENIPGDPICRTVPGRRDCRDVTETNTICRDIIRSECEWVPEHPECRQVPYKETVCRDVTKYRTEKYSCTKEIQVPYPVLTDIFNANVSFAFTNQSENAAIEFSTTLNDQGLVLLNAKNLTEKKVLILAKRKVEKLPAHEVRAEKKQEEPTPPKESFSQWSYKVLLGDFHRVLAPINHGVNNLSLRKRLLSFEVGKITHPQFFNLAIKIVRKKKVLLEREFKLTELDIEEGDESSLIKLNLQELGLKLKKRKKYNLHILLEAKFPGKILNHEMPELILEYSKRAKAKS